MVSSFQFDAPGRVASIIIPDRNTVTPAVFSRGNVHEYRVAGGWQAIQVGCGLDRPDV